MGIGEGNAPYWDRTKLTLGQAQERFWSNIDKSAGPDACWPWTKSIKDSGYGQVYSKALGRWNTHALAYDLAVGPVPDGMVLDHTCHNNDLACSGGKACLHRRCCNPAHLEPVTVRDNTMRSFEPRGRASDYCAEGHLKDGVITYHKGKHPGRVVRYCKKCRYAANAEWRRKRRERERE